MLSLLHDQKVARQILSDHEKAFARSLLLASDPKTPALTQCVIHQAVMPSDHLSLFRDDVARLSRQILHQEFFEIPFADEAHAGAVFLPCVNKSLLGRDSPDLVLHEVSDRKHRLLQLPAG